MRFGIVSTIFSAHVWLNLFAHAAGRPSQELIERLKAADAVAAAAMDDLYKLWEVDAYPRFLSSAWIPKHSWDQLVSKFALKIVQADAGEKSNFVISFTGSSVTAGHDTPFNKSFSVIVQQTMEKSLYSLGVTLESRNVAMGNNPYVCRF